MQIYVVFGDHPHPFPPSGHGGQTLPSPCSSHPPPLLAPNLMHPSPPGGHGCHILPSPPSGPPPPLLAAILNPPHLWGWGVVVNGWGGEWGGRRKGDGVVRRVRGGGVPKGELMPSNKCWEFLTYFCRVTPQRVNFKKFPTLRHASVFSFASMRR